MGRSKGKYISVVEMICRSFLRVNTFHADYPEEACVACGRGITSGNFLWKEIEIEIRF